MSTRYNIRDERTYKWKKSTDYVRKIPLQIRLDAKVVNWFKNEVIRNEGGSYQTNINKALLEYISGKETGGEWGCI